MNCLNFKNFALVLFCGSFLGGCASPPFKVVSEPSEAEVFVIDKETNKPQSLGVTPIIKKKKELGEFLNGQDDAGGLVRLMVKKDGFKDKELWLPLNSGGNLGTELTIKLDPSGTTTKDELATAQQVIDHLFLSQQYARTKQLERALIEIDKVLEQFPEFDRAMTMKAAILYAQGNFRESLKWYENALEINPNLKTAVDMAGRVRQNLKIPARRPSAKKKKAKRVGE